MHTLPHDAIEFSAWSWDQIEPHYRDLIARPLSQSNLHAWLLEWSHLSKLVSETKNRMYVATTVDTTDTAAEQSYSHFLDEIYPKTQAADQTLKQKLLESGLEPENFTIPLRNLRDQADLFREANLPLLSEELKIITEYDKVFGAQTVEWEGQELTIYQLQPVYMELDRSRREQAWRLAAARQLADRQAINSLWRRALALRLKIAANAGMPDYRSYRWRQLLRFDYAPEDCKRFHRAIEEAVVPAAQRVYDRRRQRLGVESLRPWDLEVDPSGRPPLKPYESIEELEGKTSVMFHRTDPQLGEYFDIMRREGLLDLDNRKGKAPGGYCIDFPVANRAFIFANSVRVHDDVMTVLHEGGHAFHVFEMGGLPYHAQMEIPMEFAEVASMGMEQLASPYLAAEQGGFYSRADAARVRIEDLERSLQFWPYMAVVDAFQHWVYENPDQAADPANCDAAWEEQWDRFIPGVDWSGLEDEKRTGWHRKLHIHEDPFYYVEYGLALLGAMQVWRNAMQNQAEAVRAYRRALALGGTANIPGLFAAAGVRFAFDAGTLGEVTALMEQVIGELEKVTRAG